MQASCRPLGSRLFAMARFVKGGTWKGLTAPKRARCPKCQKLGLGPWKLCVHNGRQWRECRYCRCVEARDAT